MGDGRRSTKCGAKLVSGVTIGPSITHSYPLKLPQDPEFLQRVDWLMELTTRAGHHLLESLWTEDWLDRLDSSSQKVYKVIGDQRVQLPFKGGQPLYLPSRIR